MSVKESLDTAAAVVALDHRLALQRRVEQFVFTAVDGELVEIAIVKFPQIEFFVYLFEDCNMSVLRILPLKLWIQFLIFKTPEDSLVLSIDVLRLNLEIHSIVLLSVDVVVCDFKYGHRRDKDQGLDAEDGELVAPSDDLLQSGDIGDSNQKVGESHVGNSDSQKWTSESLLFVRKNSLIVCLVPVRRR